KYAVGRGVEDGPSAAQVGGAEALDDFRSAGGDVAECAASDAALELAHERRRKAVGKRGKAGDEDDARHLPMARGGVFALGSQGAAAKAGQRHGGRAKTAQ